MIHIVQPGQLVADRFRIVRFIAEGGMGEVYEAEDLVLGGAVALKFLNRRNLGNEQVLRRFRREILLARKVTHPNVCRLFDVYQHVVTGATPATRDVTFVTMELLTGETLEERLERTGPMAEAEVLPLLRQMAAALAAAHQAGIIHRDFKSSNVMLVPGGAGPRAVVTDFGLARAIGRSDDGRTPLTGEMKIIGTPDYMAPEQLRGGEVSAASDIYALGVVLFEMVTKAKPYQAENTMSLLVKRISEPPRPPSQFVPTLSPRWETVILRCLESEPSDRYADVEAVVTALDDQPSTPSGTLPAPALEAAETPRPAGGRRLIPVALVLLATLALVLWAMRRPGNGRALGAFSPVQVTTTPGLELDPDFAPGGDAIAYSSDRAGSFEIFVLDLAPGGGTAQLTFGGTQAFEPAWSPDGTRIAFHSAAAGGIWVLPSTGGAPRRLTAFGSRPAWSPDGRTLAFQSESLPALADTSAPALAQSRLFLVAAEGGEPWPLTAAGEPAGGHAAPDFSPDGRRLVFTASQRGQSEIWSIGVDGDGLVPVVRDPATGLDPRYAPDGRSIFFSAAQRQVNGLWRVPVSRRAGSPSGPPARVANLGLASIRQLAISPAGKLAYTGLLTRSNLWLLPLDPGTGVPTAAPRPLTATNGRNNRPAFSPDGTRLAFDRWQLGVNPDVWTMAVEGGEPRPVTTDPGDDTIPTWIVGHNRLAFVSDRGDARALWTVDLASAAAAKLVELPPESDWAQLSPDGTRVAYHARDGGTGFNLWLLDLASGERRQLTVDDTLAGFPVWSSDGGWLAYQARDGESSHVMVIPAAGGEPVQLTFGAGESWPYSFSPDGDKIAFAGQRDGLWEVWWVSRASGRLMRLTDAARRNAYVRYPAWSPAGDRLAYELAETVGDIWLVEDFL